MSLRAQITLAALCLPAAFAVLDAGGVARAQQPAPSALPPLPSEPGPERTEAAPQQSGAPPAGAASQGSDPAAAAAPAAPPPAAAPAAVAPAAVAPADSTADPPLDDASEAKRVRAAFRGAAGFQYARLSGIPVTGARMRLGVGGQTDSGAHYGGLSVLYGSTENGLRTWDIRFGWTGDFIRAGIVRLGVDVEFGYLVVRRASVDERQWALGAGAGVHASVDLVPFGPRDDHAITLEGHFDGHLHFGNTFVWGPSILAGVRY